MKKSDKEERERDWDRNSNRMSKEYLDYIGKEKGKPGKKAESRKELEMYCSVIEAKWTNGREMQPMVLEKLQDQEICI